MNKIRHFIGELHDFFVNNDASKAIISISTIMNCIRIQSKVIRLLYCDHLRETLWYQGQLIFSIEKVKNGNWNVLMTSDLKLDTKEVFRLYSRRWVIEVTHKEMKQNLKLGKNQCRDFAGQIAGISLCLLQYNILSYVKRYESYNTFGGLFAKISKNSVELSVAERIWRLIVEVINVIAKVLNCDAMTLTEQVISNYKQIKAIKKAFDKLPVAA